MSAGGNFGRSVFQIRADRSAFKSDLTGAETDARQSSSIIDRELSKAGAALGEGSSKASQQFAQNMRATENEAKATTGRLSEGFGKFFDSIKEGFAFGGAAGVGATLATGVLETIGKGFDFVKSSIVDYGSEIQNVTNLLRGYTGSQGAANEALALARSEARQGFGTFKDLAGAIAVLTPLAKSTGEDMAGLLRLVETLAATNPEQGIQGAAFALRELASGDVQSIADRFNISRRALQEFRAQGLTDIEALRHALADMGITFDVVEQSSKSLDNVRQRLSELAQSTIFKAGGETVFNALNKGLADFVGLLGSDQVQRAAAALGDNIAENFEGIRKFFADPKTKQDIKDFGDGTVGELGRVASAAATTAGVIKDQLTPAMKDAADATLDLAGSAGSFFSDLGSGIGGLFSNTGTALRAMQLEALQATFIVKQSAGASKDELKELADEIARVQGDVDKGVKEAQGPAAPFIGPVLPVSPNTPVAPSENIVPIFDLTKEATEAATRTAAAYVTTFSSEVAKEFTQAKDILSDAMLAAVGGDATKITAAQSAQAFSLVARAMDEIQSRGSVTIETQGALRAAFGDTADSVIAYLGAIEKVGAAQTAYDQATKNLTDAQNEQKRVQDEVTESTRRSTAAISQAQAVQAAHQEQARQAIAAQQDVIDGIGNSADEAARAHERIGQALEDEASKTRENAAAAQAARTQQIKGAQDELAQTQRLAQEHAAAFAAIENGTIDQFLALNGEIDESTRRIIDAYGEQAKAALAARDAASGKADEIGVEGRKRQLELETQIRAARAAGDFATAAALGRQEDLENRRNQSREQFARLQASVAQDEVNKALAPIKAAADAQAVVDATATRAAQTHLTELQAIDAARRASEEAAIASIQKQIDANDRAAKDEADRFAAEERAARKHLDDIQTAADSQATTDKTEIEALNTKKTILDGINTARTTLAGAAVTQAEKEREAARDTLQFQKDQLTTLQAQIDLLNGFLRDHPGVTPWGLLPGAAPPPSQSGAGGGGGGQFNPGDNLRVAPDRAPSTAQFNTSVPPITIALPRAGDFMTQTTSPGQFAYVRSDTVPGSQPPVSPFAFAGGTGAAPAPVQNFHAPLVSFPDLRVDSDERAQFVIAESYRAVRQALLGHAAAGPPTFRGV